MDLYLNGAEHSSYRYFLEEAGVKNVGLLFSYILRTPRLNWEEKLSSFDKVMVVPGVIEEEDFYKLVDFLNKYEGIIDFCLDTPAFPGELEGETDVPIIPILGDSHFVESDYIAITKAQTEEIFFRSHIKEIRKKCKVHGIEWVDEDNYSCNSSRWLLGMRGFTFYFDGKELQTYGHDKQSMRVFLARKYNHTRYANFNLDLIKKGDWKEVSRLNLLAWRDYIEHGRY